MCATAIRLLNVGLGSSTSFQAQAAHFRFSPDTRRIAASHHSATEAATSGPSFIHSAPNVCNFAQTHLPFLALHHPGRRVISMAMTVQEYRANARQCLSWAESATDPENREAFFALAATWASAAARIEQLNAAPRTRAAGEPLLRRAAAG